MAYLPLSTANLPNPVIDPAQGASPEDHFNTVLWTGDGTSGRSITTGHQPDFVWTKERNSAINHIAQNSISGTGLYLHPNTTAAEQSATTLITSFDSDGFTVGNSGSINGSSDTYVAWSWKANGSGVTNTDGSITSTVSANTDAGFSIVGYTGTQSAATVGHGLSSAPEMIITKCRSIANGWPVYHKDIPNANQYMIRLNDNQTYTTAGQSAIWWNNTFPTSTVFSLGANDESNKSGGTHIAYCFHSVDGFSKFGSYKGNGSANGPFVYTGFRPSFVIIKNANFAEIWPMFDDKRDADNQVENPVYANLSSAEGTASSRGLDFLSNGFKIRGTDTSVNRSGDTHIYMAFAENPFKYSNAR